MPLTDAHACAVRHVREAGSCRRTIPLGHNHIPPEALDVAYDGLNTDVKSVQRADALTEVHMDLSGIYACIHVACQHPEKVIWKFVMPSSTNTPSVSPPVNVV